MIYPAKEHKQPWHINHRRGKHFKSCLTIGLKYTEGNHWLSEVLSNFFTKKLLQVCNKPSSRQDCFPTANSIPTYLVKPCQLGLFREKGKTLLESTEWLRAKCLCHYWLVVLCFRNTKCWSIVLSYWLKGADLRTKSSLTLWHMDLWQKLPFLPCWRCRKGSFLLSPLPLGTIQPGYLWLYLATGP